MATTWPLAAVSGSLHPLGRDLGPAAGRRAEVDDALAGLQEAVLVVDLDQLEGGARAHSPRAWRRRRRGR